MHQRRARPTLRLLQEDLTSGWKSPDTQRSLSERDVDALHPLSALEHPLIAKAVDCFGDDAADDNYVGPISSSVEIPLLEIKMSQWRGGVWIDHQTGVCWLVAAGLAKGDHEDHDDFYQRVQNSSANAIRQWLPTDEDQRLLRRETAARMLLDWEINLQEAATSSLLAVIGGGAHRFEVRHPIRTADRMATVEVTMGLVREDDYAADEIVVEVSAADEFKGQDLLWQLITRVLITLLPPAQGWDRFKETYSNITEPGYWSARAAELDQLIKERALAEAEDGEVAHYSHREHIADCTVNGTALRALCGAFFVPMQDHATKPECPKCSERHSALPG